MDGARIAGLAACVLRYYVHMKTTLSNRHMPVEGRTPVPDMLKRGGTSTQQEVHTPKLQHAADVQLEGKCGTAAFALCGQHVEERAANVLDT